MVLPSRSEGLPTVVLEAVALGSKVICPPGIPEFDEHMPHFVLSEVSADAIANALDEGERAARKAAIYAELAESYRRMSTAWAKPRPYGHWFDDDGINNAHLAQVATYDHWVPAFTRLWEQGGGDPAAFHRAVAELGGLSPVQRRQRLEALMPLSEGRVAP